MNTKIAERLPDLPGCIDGIVGKRTEGKRDIYTLQCWDCLATEEPVPLVTMTFKFIRTFNGEPYRRRCPGCTEKHRAICDNHPTKE